MTVPPRLAIALLLATLASLPGCREESAPPQRDADTPRLAVLSPAFAVILHDLGRAETIAARHAFDEVSDPAIPVAGDQNALDYEVLASVDPTHIILEDAAQDPPPRLLQFADDRGWQIAQIPALSLDDIPGAITRLDDLSLPAGATRPSDEARALLNRFDSAIQPDRKLAARAGRTLLVTWTDPIGVMGPGSFHHDLARRLAMTPLPAHGAPYITLSPEEVIELDPDSIILLIPGADPDRIPELLGPISRLDLRAVRKNRVALMNDDLVLSPSTAMIDLARRLREQISKWPPLEPTPLPEE